MGVISWEKGPQKDRCFLSGRPEALQKMNMYDSKYMLPGKSFCFASKYVLLYGVYFVYNKSNVSILALILCSYIHDKGHPRRERGGHDAEHGQAVREFLHVERDLRDHETDGARDSQDSHDPVKVAPSPFLAQGLLDVVGLKCQARDEEDDDDVDGLDDAEILNRGLRHGFPRCWPHKGDYQDEQEAQGKDVLQTELPRPL